MGRLTDYFGRFWYGSEIIFGIIMASCFVAILRDPALRSSPLILNTAIEYVISATIWCCVAWGAVDGVFYFWEDHYETRKRNRLISAAKGGGDPDAIKRQIAEDLEETVINSLEEGEKTALFGKLAAQLAKAEHEPGPTLWEGFTTVFLDTLLNVVGGLAVLLPIMALRGNITFALPLSNLTGISLLFIVGFWREEARPLSKKLKAGILTALLGAIITAVTVFLGG
jgi:hypothetical protein